MCRFQWPGSHMFRVVPPLFEIDKKKINQRNKCDKYDEGHFQSSRGGVVERPIASHPTGSQVHAMGKVPVPSALSKHCYHRSLLKSILNLTQQWCPIINFSSKNSPVVPCLYQHMFDSLKSQQPQTHLWLSNVQFLPTVWWSRATLPPVKIPLCVLN